MLKLQGFDVPQGKLKKKGDFPRENGEVRFSPEFPEGIHKKVWKKGKRRVIMEDALLRPPFR